jgi:hypothetical protein
MIPLAIISARSVGSMDPRGRNYYDTTTRHNIELYARAAMMERE